MVYTNALLKNPLSWDINHDLNYIAVGMRISIILSFVPHIVTSTISAISTTLTTPTSILHDS